MSGVGVCMTCQHFESEHRLAPDADVPDGPFICRACGCSISQFSPVLYMTNAHYDRLTPRQNRMLRGATHEQVDSAECLDWVLSQSDLRRQFEAMAKDTDGREPQVDDFAWLSAPALPMEQAPATRDVQEQRHAPGERADGEDRT